MKVEIKSEYCFIEKDYSNELTWFQLSQKLYEITGILPQDMTLKLTLSNGSNVISKAPFSDSEKWCDTFGIIHNIYVNDSNEYSMVNILKNERNIDDSKFNLSEQDYESRTDSVLNWKRKNKLGRFNENYQAKMELEKSLNEEHSLKLQLNERCSVKSDGKERRGNLRFIGFIPELNDDGIWCGVEFDEPVGKNNGIFKGKTYFGPVKPNYGGFVKPINVETGSQFTPLLDDELNFDSDEL